MIEAWIRRGSPFDLGYYDDGIGNPGFMPYTGRPGFSFPLLFGILGLLFSFGCGILFFAPGLWLSFFERERSALRVGAYRLLDGHACGVGGRLRQMVVVARLGLLGARAFTSSRRYRRAISCAAHVRREGQAAWVNLAALAGLAAMIWVGIDGVAFGIGGCTQDGAQRRRWRALHLCSRIQSALSPLGSMVIAPSERMDLPRLRRVCLRLAGREAGGARSWPGDSCVTWCS